MLLSLLLREIPGPLEYSGGPFFFRSPRFVCDGVGSFLACFLRSVSACWVGVENEEGPLPE